MTPEEALKIVDQICASVNLDRATHIKLQQAVQVLSEAIKPKKPGK